MNDKLSLKDILDPSNDNLQYNNNDIISIIATNELINSKNIKRISRINPEQVMVLSKLFLFADTFKTTFVKRLATNILDLQISIKGLGRKELVQLVQHREMGEDTNKIKDIFR